MSTRRDTLKEKKSEAQGKGFVSPHGTKGISEISNFRVQTVFEAASNIRSFVKATNRTVQMKADKKKRRNESILRDFPERNSDKKRMNYLPFDEETESINL